MKLLKAFVKFSIAPILLAAATWLQRRSCPRMRARPIPRDVQQLVVIDYRAMQNSTSAMDLRDRVMPPELKQFDEALRKSGLNDNHDVDQLAFALCSAPSARERLAGNRWHRPGAVLRGRIFWPAFASRRSSRRWCAPTSSIRWPRRGWWPALLIPRPWFSAARMR